MFSNKLKLFFLVLLLSVPAMTQGGPGGSINNPGVGAVGPLTNGLPVRGNGSGVTSVSSSFDVTAFAGADPCAAFRATFTAAANGQTVDGRGFSTTASLVSYGATTWPDAKCSVNPFPNTAQASALLPPLIFHAQQAWAIPLRMDVTGMGWDANTANAGGGNGTGVGATTIAGCKSTDSACNSVNFPAAPGGPILCWGAAGLSGNCDRGGASPIFDSPIRRVTIDCNGILGCIGVQDMNCEEGCGLDTVKIENAFNDGRALSIAGGVLYNFAGAVTVSGTTVTGTGFTSDLLFNQVQFSTDVTCAGGPCNFTVAAINSAGTSITLDQTYTGTACAGCTMNNANAAAQNGFFYNLYIVHRVALTATVNGIGIAMNTGSGSNEGPKFIRMVTAVNSSATQVNDMMRLNGCCTDVQDIHEESFVDGVSFGKDNVANGFTLLNLWVGSVSAGSSSAVTISNTFATANIGLHQIKTINPNKPTNIIKDLICSNTITTISESSMQLYVLGSSSAELVTSSHTVPSRFFGLQVSTSYSFFATSAASGTGWFQAAANTIGASISGTETLRFISTGIKFAGTNAIQFANGVIANAVDLSVGRTSVNTLSIGTTTVNGLGFLQSSGVRVIADSTYGTGGNVITTTVLTTIPGLTWNVPAVAQAYKIDCDIIYSQATAAAANSFAVQAATVAPTRFTGAATAQITVGPPSTYVSGNGTTSGIGTLTLVTFTPGAVGTLYEVHIHALLVNSANANAVNILAATGNIADLLTIKQDSACHIEVTAN